jgi:hypothetical protein
MLCRVKTRGEGSRGPAGGGVVGGEGLRVFQYWYRPSYAQLDFKKGTNTQRESSKSVHHPIMSHSAPVCLRKTDRRQWTISWFSAGAPASTW